MLVAWLAVVLAGAPVKVAVPGLSYVNLDAKTGAFYVDYFAQQLALHPGISVSTQQEISVLLGMDRERQLLGCEATHCAAELAGVLGVDRVVMGSLAKAGGGFVVNLKVLDANDASTFAIFSERVESETALLDYLKSAADQLAARLVPGSAPAPSVTAPPSASRRTPVVPWVVSGVLGAGGVVAGEVLFAIGGGKASSIASGDPSITSVDQLRAARRTGQTDQAFGLSLMTAGSAALVTALALWLLPPDSTVRKLSPGILGVASLIGGGVLLGLAQSNDSAISSGSTSIGNYASLESARAAGEAQQTAGWALVGAGVIGVASSVLLYLLEGGSEPSALNLSAGSSTAFVYRF